MSDLGLARYRGYADLETAAPLKARLALDQALPAFTANPAALLRLRGKGSIAMGADADLVQLDATGNAQTVIIRGQVHVRDGVAIRRGTFET